MGWKPGKLLKKAFKGVKKVVKKIGKGIKKVAFKLFGALGKIGPLGQLALMFIGIPPVISNFFGSIGGAVGGWVSRVAPNMAKAFNAIKTAGQGAYNTITEAIGNGIDRVMNFTKGKGFTLSGDRTSIFAPKDVITKTTTETAATTTAAIDATPGSFTGEGLTDDIVTGGARVDPNTGEIIRKGSDSSLLSPDKTKNYFSSQLEDFKEVFTNPGQALGEAVKQGGLQAASGLTTRKLMGDPPTQNVVQFNPSDYMTPTTQQRLEAATWNTINNSYQRAGSSFGAAGDAMTPYFTELANFDKDINYQRQLEQLNPVFHRISY